MALQSLRAGEREAVAQDAMTKFLLAGAEIAEAEDEDDQAEMFRAIASRIAAGENTEKIMPHVHDMYAALGIKWGDNPFTVIQALRHPIPAAAAKLLETRDEIPHVLFDGYAVYSALSEQAKTRTGHENVADTLDAVVCILRAASKGTNHA
jgi:hypothetical protein